MVVSDSEQTPEFNGFVHEKVQIQDAAHRRSGCALVSTRSSLTVRGSPPRRTSRK